jgi:Family of unknown function (DUF6445)
MPSIIITDGFYKNPDEVRAEVLASPFNFSGNYPGKRTTPFRSERLRKTIQELVGRDIATENADDFRTQFQIATAGDRSWVHYDSSSQYAGVLYLTPEAPLGCGTSFFRHRETGADRYSGGDDTKFNLEGCDDTKWVETDIVCNRYNRLVLYDSKLFHRSSQYFGESLESGRLFQVFFFNFA